MRNIVQTVYMRLNPYKASLQGLNFESCVWKPVSFHSSHHPQEVLLAQFSLYVHKSGLKPDSFNLIFLTKSVYFYANDGDQSVF